jgi:uncharacterized membrane protein
VTEPFITGANMESSTKPVTEATTKTIEEAMAFCEKKATEQKQQAQIFLRFIYLAVIAFISAIAWAFFTANGRAVSSTGQNTVIVSLIAATIGFVGISITQYRYHINEASRMEFYFIAFLRIRVAARNIKEGWKSDVRTALTNGAFNFIPTSKIQKQKSEIDSPIPGHPTSDIATAAVNKLISLLEKKDEKINDDDTE